VPTRSKYQESPCRVRGGRCIKVTTSLPSDNRLPRKYERPPRPVIVITLIFIKNYGPKIKNTEKIPLGPVFTHMLNEVKSIKHLLRV
jgi:hypothetical protein